MSEELPASDIRPGCPYKDCKYIAGDCNGGLACVGVLLTPITHNGTLVTHRLCLRTADGKLADLLLNHDDLGYLSSLIKLAMEEAATLASVFRGLDQVGMIPSKDQSEAKKALLRGDNGPSMDAKAVEPCATCGKPVGPNAFTHLSGGQTCSTECLYKKAEADLNKAMGQE